MPYIIYNATAVLIYLAVFAVNLRSFKKSIQESRFYIFYLGILPAVCFFYGSLATGAANVFHLPILRTSVLYFLFLILPMMAWSLIADNAIRPGFVIFLAFQRFIFVGAAGITFLFIWNYFQPFSIYLRVLEFSLCVLALISLILKIDTFFRKSVRADNQEQTAEFFNKISYKTEPNGENLSQIVSELCEKIETYFSADKADILLRSNNVYVSPRTDLTVNDDDPAVKEISFLGFCTPLRLMNARSGGYLSALHFLKVHEFGAIIGLPSLARPPSAIICIGKKHNKWPFTGRDIQLLYPCAEVIYNRIVEHNLSTQAAFKAKAEHLAITARGLAHDLKNLITPVSSFLDHAKHRAIASSREAEAFYSASRSVRVMRDYVHEALLFSERLSPVLEPFKVETLFARVEETIRLRGALNPILVAYSSPSTHITADCVMIQRVLCNLLDNAIEASTPHQQVTLSFDSKTSFVCFIVIDSGTGIAPDSVPHVFEPYFSTKKTEGLRGFGLGLTICQKIIGLHGGSIEVSSHIGKGTSVTVNLPQPANMGKMAAPLP